MARKRTLAFYSHLGGSCSKFINEFFPPSRKTNLSNEISNFQQRFDESFYEAWDRYKDLLRVCPHHGFTELHQLDTFHNALNPANQDSLNAVVDGNLLERRTQDVLTITKNKSKCLAAGVNTFLELRDDIQGYVTAAAVNYNQGNFVYRPLIVPLNELEKVKRMNNANMKAMQTQINNVKNELRNEMKNLIQPSVSNQTNELKNMMASFFQMNTASTSGSGSLPSNTVTNPKGKLKAITTQSGIVVDGPSVPISHPFVNPEEDERKMLKALLSNKEKLQELENILLNENCSTVILKKLPEKLGDPRKFLILCGFNELKCKALADLGASINLMPLFVWKKLGLPELISTRMTLELANRAICTPVRISRDVFVLVYKFTFPVDFIIVDYESDPKVPLILGRPFLRTARALIDVHSEEMILCDDDERLTLNSMPEMFTDEHDLDDSSPLLFDEYDDDLFEVESDTENVYDDPFDSNGEKIKESKLLIDELDLPCDFLPSFEYASFLSEDFSRVDALPSTNNEDKVFNPSILIQENLFEIITHVAPEKKDKKLAISHASLMLEDFNPPLYELPFFKEVSRSKILLLFSSKNEEKVFKPGIHTSGKVHSSLISELSHQGYKIFKINQIFKSLMKIFLFSCGKDTHILAVPYL
uniref:Reverse transcriptase domain-containing protein n=1 Tax=Tanacetum cinerariifolium TaxID=118510 RepID=A0A6L2NVD3_TANCI|nr:reverse transcriptase domain-containing protein [Tanacetum cinerariifolium]